MKRYLFILLCGICLFAVGCNEQPEQTAGKQEVELKNNEIKVEVYNADHKLVEEKTITNRNFGAQGFLTPTGDTEGTYLYYTPVLTSEDLNNNDDWNVISVVLDRNNTNLTFEGNTVGTFQEGFEIKFIVGPNPNGPGVNCLMTNFPVQVYLNRNVDNWIRVVTVLPDQMAGKKYRMSGLNADKGSQVLCIVAFEDNTTINVAGQQTVTRDEGEYINFTSGIYTGQGISADKKIACYAYYSYTGHVLTATLMPLD